MTTAKWDKRFLSLAEHIAQWSKDPSTQCGAVIVDERSRVVSVGYNGFPRGVSDNEDRYADRATKYRYIVHADANALMFAQRDLARCTIYTWPMPPCSKCAGLIVQAGMERCVAPRLDGELVLRWKDDVVVTMLMFKDAGVEFYGA